MEQKLNQEIVDNTKLAEDVASKIHYQMNRQFLVKPLDPVMVTKEFSKPVSTKEAVKDDNGIEAVDYDNVETEVKEVESDFVRGIVLKVPHEYAARLTDDTYKPMDIKVGDIIILYKRSVQYFDLCRDTMIVAPYDVVAVEK